MVLNEGTKFGGGNESLKIEIIRILGGISLGIIEFEGPLHISNVMLVCPQCDEPTRVGISRDEDGLPYRVCKKCGKQID